MDELQNVEQEISEKIEEKAEAPLKFNNRAERRKFAKKLGKQGRAEMGTISETAKKLAYIDLIQKLRVMNEEKKDNE